MAASGNACYFGFLADIGQILSRARHPDSALAECARRAVPHLGDWCCIQLLDGRRHVRTAVSARRDPVCPEEILVETWADTPGSASGGPTPLEQFPAESTLVHPLNAGRRMLGILTVGMAGPGGFSREQTQLSKEFAWTVAFGLEAMRRLLETFPASHSGPAGEGPEGAGTPVPHPADAGSAIVGFGGDPPPLHRPAGVGFWSAFPDFQPGRQDILLPVGDLLQVILDALRDPILVLDSRGRTLCMNLAHAAALGFPSVAEAMAQPAAALWERWEFFDAAGFRVAPEDFPLAKALEGRATEPELFRCRNVKTGREYWYEYRAVPHLGADGTVFLAFLTGRDFTDLRAAQAELEAMAERYRLVLDAGRVGVWDLDLGTGSLAWSQRMCSIHGIDEERAPATPDAALAYVHPEDRFLVREQLRMSAEAAFPDAEYRILLPSGEVRWLRAMGCALRDAAGAHVRLFGACVDVTGRKRTAEAERRKTAMNWQADKAEAIGRLAAGMSHDFNNILMSVIGYSELIMESRKLSGELRGYAAEIHKSGGRAAEIIRQLRAYGRRQMLVSRITDLNKVIESQLPLLRKMVGKGVTVDADLDPHLHQVRVDADQIKQVILNLVMNSRDAMPAGGRILLGTRNHLLESPQETLEAEVPSGPYCLLEISDTGEGMEPHVLASIFDPFFTTKPFGMKSGLGLATVQGIIRQSGGYIQVESRLGEGTRFRIFLPKSFPGKLKPEAGQA